MNKTYFKYKYVLIFILSLIVFIGGLNYNKILYVTDNLIIKRISLIYSISKDDIGNRIESCRIRSFRKQGIEVMFLL